MISNLHNKLFFSYGSCFSQIVLSKMAFVAFIVFHVMSETCCLMRLCTSQFQNRSSPRAIPGHLTRVKLRTVGNLTQNEARPVGHLTFVSKRLSAVGSKRILQFFDSAGEPRSRVIALVDSTWFFCCCRFI